MEIYKYIESTGLITFDASVIQKQVEDEWKAALGQDLDVSPETPQGRLIAAEVIARTEFIRNNCALANQINPNVAGGVYLDAIWSLTGGNRIPAQFSLAIVTLAGVPGTIIPAGSQVQHSVSRAVFQSLIPVTLDGTGLGVNVFQAVESGPIAALANTLTVIINGVIGWESATNPDAALLGRATESDERSRGRRRITLALQGRATPAAIQSAVNALPTVNGPVKFIENTSWETQIIEGVTLVPKSIYVCVDGGDNLDIAEILVAKKSEGAAFNNGPGVPVEIDVPSPNTGQVYTVKFDRPLLVPILVRVTILASSAVVNPQDAVRSAILDYVNGDLENEPGLIIGAPVSPFELSGAINREYPQIYVKKVEISLTSPINYVVAEIPVAVYERATITNNNISVLVV